MHGRVNAGIATLSRYKIESSTRYSLTVAEDFSKLFDLDRCFVANEIQTSNDNKLIIVNIVYYIVPSCDFLAVNWYWYRQLWY